MAGERDPRRTPARGDVAAAHLEGLVTAERYVQGQAYQVSAGVAPLRRRPAPDAMQETQLLFGETFTLYDEADGWGWGQADLDSYVGYVDMEALSAPPVEPTHKIAALRTYVFSEPDLKSAPLALLSLNARLTARETKGRFARIARWEGWVFEGHLRPLDARAPDWVAVAEGFLGAPYLWGGRESLGLDCSGLIQSALGAAAIPAPRDTDMQERELGRPVAAAEDLSGLQRGDLVFWAGHVGVMLDATRLLHANAHHMATAIEPLREAAARLHPLVGPIRAVKRL